MPTEELERLTTSDELVARLVTHIEGAEQFVAAALPEEAVRATADVLEDAVERGVFVLLITDYQGDEMYLGELASVARRWHDLSGGMVTVSVDRERGVMAPYDLVLDDDASSGLAYDNFVVDWHAYGCFTGTSWEMGTEVHVPDPDPLPATYENIRHAVVQATVHLKNRVVLEATVETAGANGEREVITGRVVTVRQGLASPATNEYPGETSLVLETDDGERATIGGMGAFLEDYQAARVTLRAVA